MEGLRKIAKNHALGNPIRLGVMVYLLPKGMALFKDLQDALEITPGNLDSHLRGLERVGYIEIKKVIVDRPRTAVYLTEHGAKKTMEYLSLLKQILEESEDT